MSLSNFAVSVWFLFFLVFFFFFSSRRRHTRFDCDWSSDVCSSDLPLGLILQQAIFLFFAGILGGALNAVAGGGSFISFPALLFTGVPPIPANATNTLALWTGVTASGGA